MQQISPLPVTMQRHRRHHYIGIQKYKTVYIYQWYSRKRYISQISRLKESMCQYCRANKSREQGHSKWNLCDLYLNAPGHRRQIIINSQTKQENSL